jgi:hypothetical protein
MSALIKGIAVSTTQRAVSQAVSAGVGRLTSGKNHP